ncbi:MAG TPA: hypothetical protein PK624_13045 [Spirochaetota bacterium]|nr:hypothetical protein [Spirochaetota bacterium]HOR45712.1 hypothetical protein [Spirochaetota bacterium]HOU85767.1 hypothetical protein [Spirochaetota bacterium]HPK57394.1 hypothetical protein [Spirochaetota bacterium]HQE60065.1 hypothetical protein [Spirochaetota bacterium]
MLNRYKLKVFTVLLFIIFSACDNSGGSDLDDSGNGYVVENPVETFTNADKPSSFSVQSFNFESPWGYERTQNADRKYPIVVNGCWNESPYFTEDVRKKYPAFYLDFNDYSTESHGQTLADLIDETVKAGYRIDTNRIYLTGFSQGGSGSFKLVRGMFSKGKLFAAIIRVAGQSESTLLDAAVSKTSVWYHIGLSDTAARVSIASQTYSNIKNHSANEGATEKIITDSITGYSRTTKTLKKSGVEFFKMSEYKGLGHEPGPCYKDPEIFDWFFNQSLLCR